MAKLERKYMAHYLKVGQSYVRLGRDLEEYSPTLHAQTVATRNILGQTNVEVVGYRKSAAVRPYFAEPGDPLFEMLQDIIDGGKILDDCRTELLEVKLWNGDSTGYPALAEQCTLELTSYGGDTRGYQINFNIHSTGQPQQGRFDPEKGTFTQETQGTE